MPHHLWQVAGSVQLRGREQGVSASARASVGCTPDLTSSVHQPHSVPGPATGVLMCGRSLTLESPELAENSDGRELEGPGHTSPGSGKPSATAGSGTSEHAEKAQAVN